MFRAKKQIAQALVEIYGDKLKAVYDKSSGTAPFKAGLDLVDGYLYKKDGFNDNEQVVVENGHKFIVNWTEGQKTGFFLDQRENRALVEKYAKGRNVLNLFCYTGGFSIYALGAGAVHVDSVDSSAKAMALVDKNVEIGGFEKSRHTSLCVDALDYLRDVPEDKYDLMIVDPLKHSPSTEEHSTMPSARINVSMLPPFPRWLQVDSYSPSVVRRLSRRKRLHWQYFLPPPRLAARSESWTG